MSPYKIHEPTVISFSGGRSSAYMLYRALEANGGLPDGSLVAFANTGKEMPQTLDFVSECASRWGVNIVWLELGGYEQVGIWQSGVHQGKPRFKAKTKVVNYESASRNGEPFKLLIKKKAYLPNVMARICTEELKVRRIRDYRKSIGMADITTFIGIRGDEGRRAVKIHNTSEGDEDRFCPMWVDGVTKEDVAAFWKAQPFDLQLPNNNGTTDWGNCDLCFLKGTEKRLSIIRERPDLADWWIQMEESGIGEGLEARFRKDAPSYRELKVIATDNHQLDFGDETFPCFCGD